VKSVVCPQPARWGPHTVARLPGYFAGKFKDYYPAWIDDLADDVTVEGSLLDGAAEGPEAARTIVGTIRTLYEHQEFNFAGPYGDNGWLEDYTAQVRGEPIGCAVLTRRSSHWPAARSRRR
jgi:hypothetical protein